MSLLCVDARQPRVFIPRVDVHKRTRKIKKAKPPKKPKHQAKKTSTGHFFFFFYAFKSHTTAKGDFLLLLFRARDPNLYFKLELFQSLVCSGALGAEAPVCGASLLGTGAGGRERQLCSRPSCCTSNPDQALRVCFITGLVSSAHQNADRNILNICIAHKMA